MTNTDSEERTSQPTTQTPSKRLFPWQALSVSLALLSLCVAIVFNALAVRDSAQQSELSRQSTELATLFQVEQALRDSEKAVFDPRIINSSPRDLEEISSNKYLRLRLELLAAFGDADYIAFLFNNDYLTINGAKERWQNQLNCFWIAAVTYLPISAPDLQPNLREFAQHGSCTGSGANYSVDDAEEAARTIREQGWPDQAKAK